MKFVERDCCPACEGALSRTLLELSFADGPLGRFLRDFYRREPLEGAYRLDECLDCGFSAWRFHNPSNLYVWATATVRYS